MSLVSHKKSYLVCAELRIYVILSHFQAAVSALYWLSQFCTLKKKIRNRLREYSKIRNFITYQITFL